MTLDDARSRIPDYLYCSSEAEEVVEVAKALCTYNVCLLRDLNYLHPDVECLVKEQRVDWLEYAKHAILALARYRGERWQPIETIPHTGENVIVGAYDEVGQWKWGIGYWEYGRVIWEHGIWGSKVLSLTHWHPPIQQPKIRVKA